MHNSCGTVQGVIFGEMKKYLLLFFIICCLAVTKVHAQFETVRDSVVQLYGVVMTADSLVGIPAVSITVRGTNRGTMTNNQGVFSIVVLKGDEIEFTHVSYKPKLVTIQRNLEGNQHSVVQLMVEDTVYLPATIIKPRPLCRTNSPTKYFQSCRLGRVYQIVETR